MRLTVFITVFGVWFVSLQGQTNLSASNSNESIVLSDKNVNDVALFVAGYQPSDRSSLYQLAQTPAWKKYQKDVNLGWSKFEKVAESFRIFAKTEITSPFDTVKTLFYPFSGPDFLFANIFFPNVRKMILIGLEKPGSIPVFPLRNDSLNKTLQLYKVAIEDVIQLSFFRTLDMNKELANRVIDGTTPILLLFLARSQMIVQSVTYHKIKPDGSLQPLPYVNRREAEVVEIKYLAKKDSSSRTLLYLSTNLADPSLKKNIHVSNFLSNVDSGCVTLIKSATYLMHKPYFSFIRNLCLNRSSFILQDDSGIAFKYFDRNTWELQGYGQYSRPIKLFEEFFEPDYLHFFKTTKIKPLPFRIGYSNPSNLLIAKRKSVINRKN
ncbi:MAG: hypothetical protein N2662_01155 [Bacteroidales bacterium]|nr:hypothetical protein [Bacteroidales bacterium]